MRRKTNDPFCTAEVENVLRLAPRVLDAAVIATPHPVLGEEVCAYVESSAKLSVDGLTEHCKAHLADYKVPRVFRPVNELPRNSMGRVLKAALRERESSIRKDRGSATGLPCFVMPL